jgi:transposase-like protein
MRFLRLSERVRYRIVDCFCADLTATQCASLLKLNRKTVNTWYAEIRSRLLPSIASLPALSEDRGFKGFHERRIAKFNGLTKKVVRLHLLESRIRFQTKRGFEPLVRDVCADLLS